jgi:hypothetical protein
MSDSLELIPNSLEADAPATIAAAAASGCKTNNTAIYFKGGVTKAKLWRLKMAVDFCWDYGKRTVTSIETPTVAGYVYASGKTVGWHYSGVTNGPTNVAHRDTYGVSYYETYVSCRDGSTSGTTGGK